MISLRSFTLVIFLCVACPLLPIACTSESLETRTSKESLLVISTPSTLVRLPAGVETMVQFKVTNRGRATTKAFGVTLGLPASIKLVSATSGGLLNPGSNLVTWEFGALAAGSEQTTTLVLLAPAALTMPTAAAVVLSQQGKAQESLSFVFYTDAPPPGYDMGQAGDRGEDMRPPAKQDMSATEDMTQRKDTGVTEDMNMGMDMTPPPKGCIEPTVLTCNPDGSIPTNAVVLLPERPKAVNGMLTCLAKPPAIEGCYADRKHIFNWCSSKEVPNNSKFFSRTFILPDGQTLYWLEQEEKDGNRKFWPGQNFVGLTRGQLAQPLDLLSFAQGDPNQGWRPPAFQTFSYAQDDQLFTEPPGTGTQRTFIVKFNAHGIGEVYNQADSNDFIVSPYLQNLEGLGFPKDLWHCFAECREDEFCKGHLGRPGARCDTTKGRCVGN